MAAKSTKSKTTGKKTNTTAKKPSSNKKTTRKTTKRTTGKRKTAGRKSTGNGNSFLIDEILIWTTLAVSIILLISNFGIAGFLGDAISGFLWNVFGVAAYVIPFILYMGLLIYFLLFAEAFRENAVDEYRYNLIPFREIMRYIQYHKTIGTGRVLLNLLGNIIGFAPFGFFLPCISRRPIDLWAATLFSMEFSITVEVIQLFSRVGCCDVDDVILNTLGGMLGFLCYRVWRKYRHES